MFLKNENVVYEDERWLPTAGNKYKLGREVNYVGPVFTLQNDKIWRRIGITCFIINSIENRALQCYKISDKSARILMAKDNFRETNAEENKCEENQHCIHGIYIQQWRCRCRYVTADGQKI